MSNKRKLDSSNEINSVLPSRSQYLNDKLSHRPDRHQLVEQGILHDSQCAPSLQHAERALKRARLADELNNHLVNRPGPLDLIQNNILHVNTPEHPNLEQAIRGGQIPFKTTRSSSRRPLIFHEYTGSPSSCKPKVTKIESLSTSSNTHQVRLAQQLLLLELTSNKQEEEQLSSSQKSLEQMTRIELRDLCKQYQIPSSHTNKSKLIERIKQTQNKINHQEQLPTLTEYNPTPDEIISSLKINEEDEIELFSSSELDEILQTFPINLINPDETLSSNLIIDFDFSNNSLDSQSLINDDLFVQMLLDNDYSSPSSTSAETTFDDLFSSDSLPKITSVDEFDAFLRDFTRNLSSEVSTPIS
jgi:hypothetical protein